MVKFSFCGGNDAPDWLLAEISLLSQLSSVRVKLLAVQVINELLGSQIDYSKIPTLVGKFNFSESDIRASLAALSFILQSAAQFNVSHDVLLRELQQLGLPIETCGSLSRSFRDKGDLIKARIAEHSLRLPQLSSSRFRVDSVYPSGTDITLSLSQNSIDNCTFKLTTETANVLLHELRKAKRMMETSSL
ncbi:hypothetical protein GEMRC1_011752 [Eukaryota sp. GEM-RC1]